MEYLKTRGEFSEKSTNVTESTTKGEQGHDGLVRTKKTRTAAHRVRVFKKAKKNQPADDEHAYGCLVWETGGPIPKPPFCRYVP